MNPEQKYEELGRNYRFFLNWRNLLFGGYIVLLGTLIINTPSLHKEAPFFCSLIYLFAAFASIIFRILDNRIRDLYHAAMNEGKRIEAGITDFYFENSLKEKKTKLSKGKVRSQDLKIVGYFTNISEDKGKISHSTALDFFYYGSAGLLFIGSGILFFLAVVHFCIKFVVLIPDLPLTLITFLQSL